MKNQQRLRNIMKWHGSFTNRQNKQTCSRNLFSYFLQDADELIQNEKKQLFSVPEKKKTHVIAKRNKINQCWNKTTGNGREWNSCKAEECRFLNEWNIVYTVHCWAEDQLIAEPGELLCFTLQKLRGRFEVRVDLWRLKVKVQTLWSVEEQRKWLLSSRSRSRGRFWWTVHQ